MATAFENRCPHGHRTEVQHIPGGRVARVAQGCDMCGVGPIETPHFTGALVDPDTLAKIKLVAEAGLYEQMIMKPATVLKLCQAYEERDVLRNQIADLLEGKR